MTPPSPSPLEAALALARRGVPVFPVFGSNPDGSCSCGNLACDRIGKHPRTPNGFHDATTDERIICDWFSQWPDANLAVPTGTASNRLVLDVDDDKGGTESLAALEAEYGPLPSTLTARTGHGWHYHFAYPGVEIRSSSDEKLGAGLHVRADGGYIIVPPSRHENGTQYAWVDERQPVACPPWLINLLVAAQSARSGHTQRSGRRSQPAASPERIPGNERNNRLASIAGSLRATGLTEDEIDAALQAINTHRCDPPLSDAEVHRVAASIAKYEPGASGSERERLQNDLANVRLLLSTVMRVLGNPHLKRRALFAVRLALAVESIHDDGPTADGYVRVSDAILADRYRHGKEPESRKTRYRYRKQLEAWGLFKSQTRTAIVQKPRVDLTTGEVIGTYPVRQKETWVLRDRPLIDKLQQLASFTSAIEADAAEEDEEIAMIADGLSTLLVSAIGDTEPEQTRRMCQFDTYTYVTTEEEERVDVYMIHPDTSSPGAWSSEGPGSPVAPAPSDRVSEAA